MDAPFALINRLTAKPGKRAEVIELLLDSGELIGDNPARVFSIVSEDASDPDVIWVQDLWTSEEAHTSAMAVPELRPYIEKTLPLLEGMPVQTLINPVVRKAPSA